MQDRHGITYSDFDLQSHRVSAAPYVKGGANSRSSCTNAAALPKLSDAIENVYSPHSSFSPSNTVRTSSPASYAYGTNNGVSLRDPYMKPTLDVFAPMYTQDMYSPQDFQTYSPEVTADLWIQPSYGAMTDSAYYNGQIFSTPPMGYMNAPTMVVSPPSGGASAPPPYTPYPQGNGAISVGSISPHSSRSSSSSPVSSLSSLHTANKPVPAPSFQGFVPIHPQGQY